MNVEFENKLRMENNSALIYSIPISIMETYKLSDSMSRINYSTYFQLKVYILMTQTSNIYHVEDS